jgi:tetratricopeptide (TPR) repeat protein
MTVQADWASGCSQFFKGQFLDAHTSLERGAHLYDRRKHEALAFQFGQDPCVSCLCFDAMTLWMLGYPDQAERRAQDAIGLARDLGYPFTLTWCLSMVGKYYTMRHDYERANAAITEGLTLTKEYGFSFFEESLVAYRVIGAAAQGRVDQMTAGGGTAGGFAAAGYELAHTWARSAIAEALGNLGQVDMALSLLSEARELMDRNDERYVESEIHRIYAELRLKQSVNDSTLNIQQARSEAEQSFLKAIEIARERSAKALELRAATSFSRMLIDSGRPLDALQVLEPIQAFFTEGLDCQDLKGARNALAVLKSTSTSAANSKRSVAR